MLCLPTLLLLSASSFTNDAAIAPDSWGPFQDRRIVSPTGEHYAVLRGPHRKRPANFELVRRRDGMPPLKAAIELSGIDLLGVEAAGKPQTDIRADPKDRVLAKGILTELPIDAKVTDQPLGIVMFDKYANVGRGRVLSLVDECGKLVWSRNLQGLFGRTPPGSYHTVSSLWWNARWGVDEIEGIAWVMSFGGECQTVSLKTGRIGTPKPELVRSLCMDAEPKNWYLTLRALFSRGDIDFKPYLGKLQKIAIDKGVKDTSISSRMFAALLSRRSGGKTDYRDLFASGFNNRNPSVANFASLYVCEITKDATAIEPLITKLNRMGQPLGMSKNRRPDRSQSCLGITAGLETWAVVDAFRNLGDFGSTRLKQMLGAKDTTPIGLISASVIWWKLGNEDLPPALEKMIRKGSWLKARDAVNALIRTHPTSLHAILLELMTARTAVDKQLAAYFLHKPHLDAVPQLKRMLMDEQQKEGDLIIIRNALAACERQ